MLFDCNGSIKEPNTYTIYILYMRKNGSVKCYEEEMSSSFSFTGMKKKLEKFLGKLRNCVSCGIFRTRRRFINLVVIDFLYNLCHFSCIFINYNLI